MKKAFILSLCFLCVCIVLVSCAQTSSTTDTTQENNTIHPPTTDTTQENNTIHSPSSGELWTLDFVDLAEYRAYMEQADLPSNFIHYDDIAHIGEFYLFSCIHPEFVGKENWLRKGDKYSGYYYSLSDGNYILHIDVNEEFPLLENNLISDSLVSNDLRSLSSKASGTVLLDSAQYQYLGGELLSIKWMCDDIVFTISMPDSSIEAPSEFIQNLLRKETASNQIKSFQATIAEKELSK